MTSRFEEVNELLDQFDDYQNEVESKKSVVKNFLEKLRSKFNKRNDFIIKGSKFYKIGSSYENTVVSPNADFDIAMVLPPPFNMDSFEMVEVDFPGLYKLKCISDSDYLNKFINTNDYLKVEELRDRIFYELISIMELMAIDGYSVKIREMGSSVTVNLKNSKETIKIDIAPQIGANILFNPIPGWCEENIPEAMTEFINSHDLHILFNLSCPFDLQNESFSHLVVQPAFNLIEKECIFHSEIVRDAVRLAKSVCKTYNWTKDGLRSFHIKRVALSLFDKIEEKGDAWDGYKLIMNELVDMLEEDGYVDGCFIEDQSILCKNEKDCHKLGARVKKTVNRIHPNNISKIKYLK